MLACCDLERNLADMLCLELTRAVGGVLAISSSKVSRPLTNFSVDSPGVKLRFSNVSFKNFSYKVNTVYARFCKRKC